MSDTAGLYGVGLLLLAIRVIITNVPVTMKLKGSIWNVKNLKDLSKINIKLKVSGDVFGLY